MADKNRERRKRKEPEYDPVVRQEPQPFPESLINTGWLEFGAIQLNDELWQYVMTAVEAAIKDQAILEDVQSLTLESRIGLTLMQIPAIKHQANIQEKHPQFLSMRWAIALAAVITELLPRHGLEDTFLAALSAPEFRRQVAQTYRNWYLPSPQPIENPTR